jgi:hypothetical protein
VANKWVIGGVPESQKKERPSFSEEKEAKILYQFAPGPKLIKVF